MEKTTVPITKYILTYGFFLGLTWIIYVFLRHITDDKNTHNWASIILELSIHIGIIVYGIYKFKRKNDGFLTLWQAFRIGVGIALICTLMQISWDIFFVKVISPESIQEVINLASQSTTSEPLEQNRFLNRENSYLFTRSSDNLIFNVTLGVLISLFAGAIMRKDRDPFS